MPTSTLVDISRERKPFAEIFVLYLPGIIAPELNDPEELVKSKITCSVAVFIISILAPGITNPDGSLTVPTMLPVPTVVWANNGRGVFKPLKIRKVRTSRPFEEAAHTIFNPGNPG